MEAELIPMCEDQGLAIVPWAALGGGQLLSTEQRKKREKDPGARPIRGYGNVENDFLVCQVMEEIAIKKGASLQAVVC